MFTTKRQALFISIILLLFTFNIRAQVNQIRIVTEHLPPFQIGKDNRLVGGSVGNEINKLLRIVLPDHSIEVMPWARAYKVALNRPNTIIFSIVRTPEREDKFIWIGKVADVSTELITLKRNALEPVKSINELRHIQIGVKRQDAVADFLASEGFLFGEQLVEIVNTFSTMKMLEKERITAIPSNRLITEYYCQTTGCNTTDFKTIYVFKQLSEEFYLAASKGTDPMLIKRLKEAFLMLDLPL